MPLETEYLIPKDAKVRLLDQVLEEMNYRGLYLTNSGREGNSTVEPVTLFMIMVLASSDGRNGRTGRSKKRSGTT